MARKVSEFVRVALEGATIDNRKITREQITQMAANYDPVNRYGARIWMEHFRSLFADGAFPALGDVLDLKAEEKDGKMGLYAKLSPTDQLLQMNQKRQKVFTSIEMDPAYADTGEAYMVGLAVTDTPASQGTEMLAFSQQNNKFSQDKLFSEFAEVEITFTDEKQDEPGLLDKVKSLFSKQKASDDERFSDINEAVTEIAEQVVEQNTNFSKDLKGKADQSAFAALEKRFNELEGKLDKEERPPKVDYRGKSTGEEDPADEEDFS